MKPFFYNNHFTTISNHCFSLTNSLANDVNLQPFHNMINDAWQLLSWDNIYNTFSQKNIGRGLNISLAGGIGAITGGIPGSIIGIGTAVIDERIIEKYPESYDKHYISNSTFWGAMSAPAITTMNQIFPFYISPLLALASTAVLTRFNADILNYHNASKVITKNLIPVKTLLDPENKISFNEVEKIKDLYDHNKVEAIKLIFNDLNYILHHPLSKSLATNIGLSLISSAARAIIIHQLGSNIGLNIPNLINELQSQNSINLNITNSNLTNFSNNTLGLTNLNGDSLNNLDSYFTFSNAIKKSLAIGGLILFDNFLHEIIIDPLKKYSEKTIDNCISEALDKKILTNKDKILQILTLENGADGISNLPGMIKTSWGQVNTNIDNSITFKLSALIALEKILLIAPDYFVINCLIQLLKSTTQHYLSANIEKKNAVFRPLFNKKGLIQNELSANIEKIVFSQLIEPSDIMFQEIKHKTEDSKKTIDIQTSFKELFNKELENMQILTNFLFFSLKFISANFKIENIVSLEHLFYNAKKIVEDKYPEITYTEIDKYLKVLETVIQDDSFDTGFKYNNEKKIIIKDFQLFNENGGIISQIPYLEIDTNKYKKCVIKAPAGWGKSTLLNILTLEIAVFPLKYSGSIELFNDNEFKPVKPMSFKQDFWMPAFMNLFEFITGKPNSAFDSDEKTNVVSYISDLFREIKIDIAAAEGRDTDSIIRYLTSDDTPTLSNFSGGQKAKICFVKAIYNKAQFMIFDETFANLDILSIENIQNMINKYLPDSVMLIIDHQSATNNKLSKTGKNFYDNIIDLDSQQNISESKTSESIVNEELIHNQKELLINLANTLYPMTKQLNPDLENLTFNEFCHENFPTMVHQLYPNFELSSELLDSIWSTLPQMTIAGAEQI